MDEVIANETLGLHLAGEFKLLGNSLSEFKGPIKKGLRLVMWGDSSKRATSCIFVKEMDMSIGETAAAEIIILSPQSIDKKIRIGETYSVGNPGIILGQFKIEKILGKWIGKVPN